MAYLVEVSREANTEILEIYVFKGENNLFDAATRWYNGIVDALDTLKDFPVRCSYAPENDVFTQEIRQLLYGRRHDVYRILFTTRAEVVYVLHVRHSSMQPLLPDEPETDTDG